MPTLNLKSATHSGIFQAVPTVDRTKVHLWDRANDCRITLPVKAFPFCELDSQSVVTITVTRVEMELDQPLLPGLDGVVEPGKLS
jgi:hypothetical protein